MKIRPLGDRVLVKSVKEEEITAFGLVLPETVEKEKKMEGEVLAIGPGKLLDSGERSKMEVNIGDRVIFKSWGGDKVELDGEEYKILSQDDILAMLKK